MSGKKKKKQSGGIGAGIIGFGALFFLFSLITRPFGGLRLGSGLLGLAIAGLGGWLIKEMAQGLDLTTHNREDEIDTLASMSGSTGDEELDALLERGRDLICQIRKENDLIPDSLLSEKLDALEKECAALFREIFDKPCQAGVISGFMEYYLPATLDNVKAYRELTEKGASRKEVFEAQGRTDDVLTVVIAACRETAENVRTGKTPDSLRKVMKETGQPEADAVLERGREMIRQIRAENDLIPDEVLSGKLEMLENSCADIFRAVYEKPAKVSQIRKFMDYYLPTTLKLVKSYRVLGEKGVSAQKVTDTRARISSALDVVLAACQKTLDNLYNEDVLDVTTDIDVLEQMLKRDGLTETDLDRAARQAMAAAQIDREAADRAARRAAEKAAAQAEAASAAEARPVVYTRTPTGVEQRVNGAVQAAQEHIPAAPTMDGGTYTAGASAQARKPE